jgi:flagellar biosynthetic protein FliR
MVALVTLPIVRAGLPKDLANLPALVRLLVVEMLIGFTFGLASRFLLSSLQLAGVIIANQMGLAFTMSINPAGGDQGQSVALSTFLTLLGISLILAANLHHVAIMGIIDSYRTLAIGEVPPTGDAAQLAVTIAQSAFSTGVQISAPFLVFGLVFNVGLGILSRMMPQLQVFFLALPASILLGTIVMIIVLTLMMEGFLAHVVLVFRNLFPGLG